MYICIWCTHIYIYMCILLVFPIYRLCPTANLFLLHIRFKFLYIYIYIYIYIYRIRDDLLSAIGFAHKLFM